MGDKLDKLERAGGTAIVALGVFDRLATRWREWRADRAEDALTRAVEASQKEQRRLEAQNVANLRKMDAARKSIAATFARHDLNRKKEPKP